MSVPSNPSQALAVRWFQKAENDLLNVENNLKAQYYAGDTVCFHCQQAAEKYLKGFLAWYQKPFARTHDLLELLAQVQQLVGDEAQVLRRHLILLDPYSVSSRYPQEYEEEPDEDEVREAVESAYVVRTWVRSKLNLEPERKQG
ncbi:MAG TPA: HEPN domain-containing protein [Anaerolineae bacterium]|nr:HEPN domain-containing protein [Anaerolineae bacterium]